MTERMAYCCDHCGLSGQPCIWHRDVEWHLCKACSHRLKQRQMAVPAAQRLRYPPLGTFGNLARRVDEVGETG